MTLEAIVKPTLRGVLHQWAASFALGAGIVLVAMAPGPRAAFAGGIYALSLVALFTVSAVYHRVNWDDPDTRQWMRRADHAFIFVLIAGTYSPVAVLALPQAEGTQALWIVWVGAALGVAQSLFWIRAPKVLTAVLAVALGWCIVPHLGALIRALSTTELTLMMLGGVAYTSGAVAYATKRPNLKPGVFGYHELFHALTIVASVFHFTMVLLIVRRA